MAVTMRSAMIACMGFTVGLCWLVTQIERADYVLEETLRPVANQTSPEPRYVAPRTAREQLRPAPTQVPLAVAASTPITIASIRTIDDEAEPITTPELPRTAVAMHDAADSLLLEADVPQGFEFDLSEPVTALRADGAPPRARSGESRFEQYEVQRGDSLARIAKRFYGDASEARLNALVAANPHLTGRRDRILLGETLRIPLDDGQTTGSLPATSAPAYAWAAPANEGGPVLLTISRASSQEGAHVADATEPDEIPTTRDYVVQTGDTLSAIARAQLGDERRWPEIVELNQLTNADRIHPGMRIRLPRGERGA